MSERNLENLVFHTLVDALAEVTGISSGSIFAKMPDFEFVSKFDGNNQPSTNPDKFPCIGMRYWDKVKVSSNSYGDSKLIDNGDGTGIDYQPLNEIEFPISIYLFTDSRKDQNTIGNKIYREFAQNPFYDLFGDEFPTGEEEQVSVQLIGFSDTFEHRPYVKVYDILCNARDFLEVSGYLVDYGITVNLQSQVNSITVNTNAEDTFNYYAELPPDEIDEDTIYFQDWNIVQVDLTDDFGGEHERTIDDNP